ncbi:unnamed protein product [Ranitomeya imitator]|uniref:BTB domain-containing protein n=1 Tax=Ranitomeya imitator TaxID=111125 RepID=A0ABN9LVA4_9NEOB|nr:unnamed protein product [Ranitomeya imitator]
MSITSFHGRLIPFPRFEVSNGRLGMFLVKHFACSSCNCKLPSGQSSPLCQACSSPIVPTSQDTPADPPEIDTPIPGWASSLSQSVADLTRVSQTLVSVLDRLLLQTPAVASGSQEPPSEPSMISSKRSRQERRSESSSRSISPHGPPLLSASSRSSSPESGEAFSDAPSEDISELDSNQIATMRDMVQNLIGAINQTYGIKDPSTAEVPNQSSRTTNRTYHQLDGLFLGGSPCFQAVHQHVTLKNAAELLELAALYNADQLKVSCFQFIGLNMAALLEARSLDVLSQEVLKELASYYRKMIPAMDKRLITPYLDGPDISTLEYEDGETFMSTKDDCFSEQLTPEALFKKAKTKAKRKPRKRSDSSGGYNLSDIIQSPQSSGFFKSEKNNSVESLQELLTSDSEGSFAGASSPRDLQSPDFTATFRLQRNEVASLHSWRGFFVV